VSPLPSYVVAIAVILWILAKYSYYCGHNYGCSVLCIDF
jgi:hypothetical protein